MRRIILTALALFSLCSCKEKGAKSRPEPKLPTAPAKEPSPAAPPQSPMTPLPKEAEAQVKMLQPSDPLSCASVCLHLGYCHKQHTMRAPSLRRHNLCVGKCKGDRTPTGKLRTEIQRSCVDQHRGNRCDALMKCMRDRLIRTQKNFKAPPR